MRQHSTIHFKDTGYFSNLMCDYLDQNEKVNAFYNHFPNIEGFRAQIIEKQDSFNKDKRIVLYDCLRRQYKGTELSESTEDNLKLLKKENTFTITTGHQLNLFTGPLYFLYKIISVINLTRQLKLEFPEKNFVPVYWMATEDHDFEEIKYFNYKGKKIKWDREPGGAVGKLSTEGMEAVYDIIEESFGTGSNSKRLKSLFYDSYLKHKTLTEATRYLANELFAAHGLVIVDGDDSGLKRVFTPYVEKELIENNCFKTVSKTNESLSLNYPIQVNPREINLFYLDKGLRERILFQNERFQINNTNLVFEKEDFINLVREHPEKFSPNVLMRPLYQEVILPNLCYIGGGGEMAYWLQLKGYFNEVKVPFPILLLRNSVLLLDSKYERKMEALGIEIEEIFLNRNQLIKNKVKQISDIEIDFSKEKMALSQMFGHLKSLSDKTDKSFSGAVLAQEKKQLNGLEKLEKRLLKAQKRKYAEIVDRIIDLKEQLFPKSSLQERQANFSEFYELYGDDLIPLLIDCLDPLKLEFDVIRP
ncbi:bacillithiol biosynthesis cysteine-adding enzyme BshC [Lutimonas saemankumensis]|uniref:bacillithiol biosynthesis cysteine-adding enzyme BshC n=1 Tax=Lutimonas saemankumensis TaxID=483016 RepID=UPI001CD3120B|nr:bacillithiol biosynthesis cysteine-adding enzyme BshC [Lutimonas saemankumensis]MCA0933845.1 bacillithiol biosynthesis cysteine-adding enzyme BshC [Lutimonas saemankumensis]